MRGTMGTQDDGDKSWLRTLPGLMTTTAAVLTAITGLVAALSGLPIFHSGNSAHTSTVGQDCISPYVWRKAYQEDYVCVTAETHMRTLQDNELAGSRRA